MVAVGKAFEFEVVVAASTVVRAGDGAETRAVLERALDGVTAIMRTGSGSGLGFSALRLAGTFHLATTDRVDPLVVLEAALRRLRGPPGQGGS